MHSSRMRTVHNSSWLLGGIPAPGVSAPGVVCSQGVCLVWGGVVSLRMVKSRLRCFKSRFNSICCFMIVFGSKHINMQCHAVHIYRPQTKSWRGNFFFRCLSLHTGVVPPRPGTRPEPDLLPPEPQKRAVRILLESFLVVNNFL